MMLDSRKIRTFPKLVIQKAEHLQSDCKRKIKRGRAHSTTGIALLLFIMFCYLAVSPAQAEDNTSIQCGVILPLSGDMSVQGLELKQGIELAAEEVNAQGGIRGRLINLIIADDEGNPDRPYELFREMREKGASVVIGSYTTDLTIPMAKDLTTDPETVLISPQANGQALYGVSPAFFQVNAPVFYLGKFLADWASYTAERVAIVYIDNEFGSSLTESVTSNLAGNPVQITSTEPVSPDSDFSALSRKVLDNAPDIIIFNMYGSLQVPLLQNLSNAGYHGQVVLTDTSLINTLEQDNADLLSAFSVCSISSNAATVPGNRTERFAAAYEKKYGSDPKRGIAGYGYDTMMVIRDALNQKCTSGNITASDIMTELKNTSYYGVTGPKIFDDKNAVRPALDRWVFRDGKFELMTTSII
jgi:branched-chain amino acid transport system substrate-binding protein